MFLTWQTSVKNHRVQAVYDRCGAMKSNQWLTYTLSLRMMFFDDFI